MAYDKILSVREVVKDVGHEVSVREEDYDDYEAHVECANDAKR